jgi:hypothetical protein
MENGKPKLLEEVFKTSGIPSHTFVKPLEYAGLLVALRTPGRGVVIEGPSGIGKTTSVSRALEELGLSEKVSKLSARRPDDVAIVRELSSIRGIGTVIIDDFHKLDDLAKRSIADLMKVLADEESRDNKIVILGINKAGESLVRFASDLNNRLEVISLESNPPEKVEELLRLGEKALNLTLNVRSEIAAAAHGSFYIAQMLAHQVCLDSGLTEEQESPRSTAVSFEATRGRVQDRLARSFLEPTQRFARGTRFRREGRAPYLNLLHLLAMSEEWSLPIDTAIMMKPELSGSITQIVDKGYLRELVENDVDLPRVLYFDQASKILTVEDPQYVYYLRNISWPQFATETGFLAIDFPCRYDIALSFAGSDRRLAEALFVALTDFELEVFYDKNEQHRILAEDVEDYLRPIYQSDARLVVALLGPDYPKRIWTRFESEQFRRRLGDNAVVPVWFATVAEGAFDESRRVGGFTFDPNALLEQQVSDLAELLLAKTGQFRRSS